MISRVGSICKMKVPTAVPAMLNEIDTDTISNILKMYVCERDLL